MIALAVYAAIVNPTEETGGLVVMAVYIVFFIAFFFLANALWIGSIRGNAIRISEEQFPEVYAQALQLARKMGLKKMPRIYVCNSNGLLNAFAAKFMFHHYVIIMSEVFELAYEKGEKELGFVLAHELAHIYRDHLAFGFALWPAQFTPFLGKALSRAAEYSCDRIAAELEPKGAESGLVCLAAGRGLYKYVNTRFL